MANPDRKTDRIDRVVCSLPPETPKKGAASIEEPVLGSLRFTRLPSQGSRVYKTRFANAPIENS